LTIEKTTDLRIHIKFMSIFVTGKAKMYTNTLPF